MKNNKNYKRLLALTIAPITIVATGCVAASVAASAIQVANFKIEVPKKGLTCASRCSSTGLVDGYFNNITYTFPFTGIFKTNLNANHDDIVITAKCEYPSYSKIQTIDVVGSAEFVDSTSFKISFDIKYDNITSFEGDQLYNMPGNTELRFYDIVIKDKTKRYQLNVETELKGKLVESFLDYPSPDIWEAKKISGQAYEVSANIILVNIAPGHPLSPRTEGEAPSKFHMYWFFDKNSGWNANEMEEITEWNMFQPAFSKNQMFVNFKTPVYLDSMHEEIVNAEFFICCEEPIYQKIAGVGPNYRIKAIE